MAGRATSRLARRDTPPRVRDGGSRASARQCIVLEPSGNPYSRAQALLPQTVPAPCHPGCRPTSRWLHAGAQPYRNAARSASPSGPLADHHHSSTVLSFPGGTEATKASVAPERSNICYFPWWGPLAINLSPQTVYQLGIGGIW